MTLNIFIHRPTTAYCPPNTAEKDKIIFNEDYSSGVENMESSTFKIAFKKCFNIGVFYVAFCMENMDVFTFEPITSFAFIFNPCKTARVQPHLSNVDTSSDFEKNPSIPKQNTPP